MSLLDDIQRAFKERPDTENNATTEQLAVTFGLDASEEARDWLIEQMGAERAGVFLVGVLIGTEIERERHEQDSG